MINLKSVISSNKRGILRETEINNGELLNDMLKSLCSLLLCFAFVIQMTAYDENLSDIPQHDNTLIIPINYVHNRESVLPTKVHIRVSTMSKKNALIKTVILRK